MASEARASEYQLKAEKLLRWAATSYDEMLDYGRQCRMDDVERLFFSLLMLISSVHLAITSYAKHLNLLEWREELDLLRESDPLLLYIWKARDSDTHDAVLKWQPGMHAMEIMINDMPKAMLIARGFRMNSTQGEELNRLLLYVYDVPNPAALADFLDKGGRPDTERLEKAGVEMRGFLESLVLMPFQVQERKKKTATTVEAPNSHLGNPLAPSARSAVIASLDFYRKKLDELIRTRASRSLKPQSAQE